MAGRVPDIYFEDFVPGAVTTFGHRTVTGDELVAFARLYDPQPFHLDEAAAAGTFVGRLIASGWHTLAIQMSMLCESWMLRAAGLGSPGIDEVEWLRPVAPGDTLTVRQTILDAKASRSRPEMGIVRVRLELLNGRGEVVTRQVGPMMFERRDATPAPEPSRRDTARDARPEPDMAGLEDLPGRSDGRPNCSCDFDEIEVGATDRLGEHTFTADGIVRFARQFDPQPFHLDEAAAARTYFGRLAASGWQTAATWMGHLARTQNAAIADATSAGREPPRFGPSPGFRDLRWLKPVFVGDTIRFATTLVEKRASATRPGWGIVFSRNTGWNQHGEKVYEFRGSRFLARAGGAGQDARSDAVPPS